MDTLKAVRRTRDQVELSAAKRRVNVADAYAARGPVAGKLPLVEDVFTTGRPERVCQVFHKAGAAKVHSLTLCRMV